MYRRELLSLCVGVGAVLVTGCNGRANPGRTQPTPTTTPWPDPTLTSVDHAEITYPDEPNTILLRIAYTDLNPDEDYTLRVSLESSGGSRTETKQLERVRGYYPGFVLMRLKPEGTTQEDDLQYEVRLIHDGTTLTTRQGEIAPTGGAQSAGTTQSPS